MRGSALRSKKSRSASASCDLWLTSSFFPRAVEDIDRLQGSAAISLESRRDLIKQLFEACVHLTEHPNLGKVIQERSVRHSKLRGLIVMRQKILYEALQDHNVILIVRFVPPGLGPASLAKMLAE